MKFSYQARTTEGKPREGIIDAPSPESATEALHQQNFIIIKLEEVKSAHGIMAFIFSPLERVSPRDVMVLSRQLATLFEADVPVVQSMRTIIGEANKGLLKRAMVEVLDDVQGGASMSQAMAKHPKIFSIFYVSMVRAGEESGKLSEVFSYLADYLERSYALMSKARNALIYPAFILLAFAAVVVVIMTVVIPKISEILEETGQELPIYTKIVIGISSFLQNFWPILFIILALLAALMWRYVQTPGGRLAWSRMEISIPLVGLLYKKIYLARIADNLETLLSSGVSVIRSLQITADVVGNEVYRTILLGSIELIKSGSTIADSFSRYKEVPSLVTQMVRIGEDTGKLNVILKSIARFYQRDVDNLVDNLVSLIEPFLIIILGAGVGILVASVLIPLYNITAAF